MVIVSRRIPAGDGGVLSVNRSTGRDEHGIDVFCRGLACPITLNSATLL
jgi:hypothetical protein